MTRWLIIALTLLATQPGRVFAEPTAGEQALGELVQKLQDPQAATRRSAATALGELGGEAKIAVGPLTVALDDVDPGVRAASAIALGKLGQIAKGAIPVLIKRLDDKGFSSAKGAVWVAASKALSKIGDDSAVPLIAALDTTKPQRFVGAALALAHLGPVARDATAKFIAALENNDSNVRRSSIVALGGIGGESKDAIAAITKMLGHKDFHTQYTACRALGRIGPPAKSATNELVLLTKEGVASVRRNAAMAIGNIGPTAGAEVVGPLTELLGDRTYAARKEAAIALGKLGQIAKPAIPALEQTMANPRLGIRVEAAKAFWLLTGQTEKVVGVLIEELNVIGHAVESAKTLGEIGPAAKTAIPALEKAMQSEHADIRAAAKKALRKIAPLSKGSK